MITALLHHHAQPIPGSPDGRRLPRWLGILFACAALGSLSGCTYRDPSVEILEGELRWMEDQLYMLEDQLANTSAELQRCRQGECLPGCSCDECGGGFKPIDDDYSVLNDDSSVSPSPRSDRYEIVPSLPPASPEPTPAEPTIALPPDGSEDDFDFEPTIEIPNQDTSAPSNSGGPNTDTSGEFEIMEPAIEMPSEIETSAPQSTGELPPPLPSPSEPGTRPRLDPESTPAPGASDLSIRLQTFAEAEIDSPRSADPTASSGEMVDAHVTHVVAHGRLAHGVDFDQRETAADMLVVVEPRNRDGNYVALAAPISLVVLDGKAGGSAARVARWDFDAAAVRRRFRSSPDGHGAHFSLTWPSAPPQSDQLYLFVRYVTVEGRRLETDVPLETDVSRHTSGQWKVIRPENRRASWNTEMASPLKPVRASIQLEPIPSEARTGPRTDAAESGATAEADWNSRAVPPASGESDTQEGSPEPAERVMPVLVESTDGARPTWKPER